MKPGYSSSALISLQTALNASRHNLIDESGRFSNGPTFFIYPHPFFAIPHSMNEKHFLYLSLSFGTLHIDESVFAFILGRNLGNFDRIKDKQWPVITLFWCIVPIWRIAITGVGYCLFDTGFPEPLPDKRKMLHTFFFTDHIRGAG